jgi:hypothetical protein
MEENACRHETCDLPLCEECAIKYNGFDFCPYHNKLRLQATLPERLEKVRMKIRAKLR